MDKRRFLIAHPEPSGSGTRVLYIWARSEEEVSEVLPDAEIWNPAPQWMTEEMKERAAQRQYDVDSPLDVQTLTSTPDLVFDRVAPPRAGARKIRDMDELRSAISDPDLLEKAEKVFAQRPL